MHSFAIVLIAATVIATEAGEPVLVKASELVLGEGDSLRLLLLVVQDTGAAWFCQFPKVHKSSRGCVGRSSGDYILMKEDGCQDDALHGRWNRRHDLDDARLTADGPLNSLGRLGGADAFTRRNSADQG